MFRVETALVREGVETIMNIDKHYSTHFQVIQNNVNTNCSEILILKWKVMETFQLIPLPATK